MAKINCLVSDSKVRTDTSYLAVLSWISFLFPRIITLLVVVFAEASTLSVS